MLRTKTGDKILHRTATIAIITAAHENVPYFRTCFYPLASTRTNSLWLRRFFPRFLFTLSHSREWRDHGCLNGSLSQRTPGADFPRIRTEKPFRPSENGIFFHSYSSGDGSRVSRADNIFSLWQGRESDSVRKPGEETATESDDYRYIFIIFVTIIVKRLSYGRCVYIIDNRNSTGYQSWQCRSWDYSITHSFILYLSPGNDYWWSWHCKVHTQESKIKNLLQRQIKIRTFKSVRDK